MSPTSKEWRARVRSLSDYCTLHDGEPDFGAVDALALALQLHRARQSGAGEMVAHYEPAFHAVCAALGLSSTALDEALSARAGFGADDPSRPLAIRQLVRLRLALTSFCDEWGSFLEGDVWGARLRDPVSRESMRAARRWYVEERSRLPAGVADFDEALLQLLGWQTEKTVSLAELRERHGYPGEVEFDF